MSEFVIHRARAEKGLISSDKEPYKDEHKILAKEKFTSKSLGNDSTSGQHITACSVISNEQLNNISKRGESDLKTERDEKNDINHGSVENVKFCESLSEATSVIHKETVVDSSYVPDKTPLLFNESTDGETETSETSCECSYLSERDSDHSSLNSLLTSSQTRESLMIPGMIKVPIVGHETMESRSKFTVFKINVMVDGNDDGWFIFRRYSDFVHLNDQLKILFPNFRLSLPPKRWFRNNFEIDFLEERVLGLQAFIDNVTGHRDICNSKPVRYFFCFDAPPGPHDSLEESRAQCESMEDMIYTLRKEVFERDTELQLLKEELDLYKNQVQLLTNRLSELNRRSSFERSGSEKQRSSAGEGHLDINVLLGSGGKLLANKLDTVSKPRSQHLKRNEQMSTAET